MKINCIVFRSKPLTAFTTKEINNIIGGIFALNRESNRQSKEQRYGSGQIDIFCFVALPLDKIFFLAYEETQNSVAKTIDNIIAINTKDTLLQALEQANKPPKLKPLDLE
jgi:hypothetical protein